MDAKTFLSKHGEEVFGKRRELHGALALLSHDTQAVDHYVAEHREVTHLDVVFFGKKPNQEELDFFGVLKKRYQHHHIEVGVAGPEHELSRKGPELSL